MLSELLSLHTKTLVALFVACWFHFGLGVFIGYRELVEFAPPLKTTWRFVPARIRIVFGRYKLHNIYHYLASSGSSGSDGAMDIIGRLVRELDAT